MLNLPAMIALFRLAKKGDRVALIVLLISLLAIPGPGSPLESGEGMRSLVLRNFQTAIRLLMLAFLMHRAWIQRRGEMQAETVSLD
jgi:hypothetical protein